jgi:hypothetical protein
MGETLANAACLDGGCDDVTTWAWVMLTVIILAIVVQVIRDWRNRR